MSPSHITEWATNVTMTYNWVSNKCHHHILSWWHLLPTQLYVMVTFVSRSVICDGDICCSLSYMWWWHLLLTQVYVMVTFVAHSVICDGDICCSLSYMSWWHLLLTQIYVMVTFVAHSVIWHITEWATNVTITYNWVSNKCHHDI
jgi:hypothetical protein